MRTFESILRLKGFPITEARSTLSAVQGMEAAVFKQHTEKLRNEIFEFHCAKNMDYREFTGKALINEWTEIPVITKNTIQKKPEERLSDGYRQSNVYLNNTSGSTGKPFYFAKDKFAHAMTWAVIMDRYGRHDIDLNHSLQARFYGIPLSTKGYIKEKATALLS